MLNNKYKTYLGLLIIISQLYAGTVSGYSYQNELISPGKVNETCLITSFDVYNIEATINNKTSFSDKVLNAQKFLNDNFYLAVLTIAEEVDLLYFINSEKTSNRLLELLTEESSYRSPPKT